ncbi:neuroligin-4, X-linked-like [Oculina patagonica]
MFSTLLASLFVFCVYLPLVKSVTVSTKYGDIEGLVASYPNASGPFKSVSKFLGVPFAAPPIGELRLRPPKPPQEWKPKIRQTKKHGDSCFQPKHWEKLFKRYTASTYNFTYSEDCLYLDVYTPNVTMSLPVMVYIHGGAFAGGTAVTFNSDILALYGVVVVVIQYRLGPFGFLTTGDSAAPGNFGMLDQIEALKWVKENIEHFGGNPNKVTIFGESAGGKSVGLLLLSPLSKGLFHQAIAESGVDLCLLAFQPIEYGIHYAKELAQKLDCATSGHSAMVACIRDKKATEVQKAAEAVKHGFIDVLMWAPVVDKHFLFDTPRKLRENGEFTRVKLMISFNSDEGGTDVEQLSKYLGMTESVDNGVSPSFFKEFLTKLSYARNFNNDTAELITDAMEFMYTPWPDNSNKYALRSQLVDLIGDYVFVAASHKVADIHSQHAPVYMYEFAHRSVKASIYPEWMGVAHFENVLYDFGVPFFPGLSSNYDAADRNVSLFIMEVYANFAKTGDPTPQPVSGVMWERYNSSHRAYLRVDAHPKMAAAFAPRRMAFWNDYYPKLAQVKFDTKHEVVSGASAGVAIAMSLHITLIVILEML